MTIRRDVHGSGPVCESTCSDDSPLRDAVKLDTLLQTIPSVDDGVRVGGAESGEAWGEQLILTLYR